MSLLRTVKVPEMSSEVPDITESPYDGKWEVGEADWTISRPHVALETNLARKGFVRLGNSPAEIEGNDLMGPVAATIPLRLIDLDVLAWLAARRPWGEVDVLFSRSRLAHDLFDRAPGGRERSMVNESLQRLNAVSLTFVGHYAPTRKRAKFPDVRLVSELERVDYRTSRVGLAPWLAQQLEEKYVTYLDWATLRALRGLSKRLWIYLEAEDHQRRRKGPPWLALGEKTWTALGLDFKKPAQARAAIRRAAARIEQVDPRYRLAVKPRGPTYRLEFQLVERQADPDGDESDTEELTTSSGAPSPAERETVAAASDPSGAADAEDSEDEDGDASRVVEVSATAWPWVSADPTDLLAVWGPDSEAVYHRVGCPEILDLKGDSDSIAKIQLAPRPADLAAWLVQSRIRAPLRCHFCRPPDLPFWFRVPELS